MNDKDLGGLGIAEGCLLEGGDYCVYMGFLRIPDSYDAKIAKICKSTCNSANKLLKILQKAFLLNAP